jgi:hypothetical protein
VILAISFNRTNFYFEKNRLKNVSPNVSTIECLMLSSAKDSIIIFKDNKLFNFQVKDYFVFKSNQNINLTVEDLNVDNCLRNLIDSINDQPLRIGSGMFILLRKIKINLNQRYQSSFVKLRSGVSLTIISSVFYIKPQAGFDAVIENIGATINNQNGVLEIINSEFKVDYVIVDIYTEELKKNFLIFSRDSFTKINIKNVQVYLDKTTFSSMIWISGANRISIVDCAFFGNIVNSSISKFITIQATSDLSFTMNKTRLLSNRVSYGGLLYLEVSEDSISFEKELKIILLQNTFMNMITTVGGGLLYLNLSNIEQVFLDRFFNKFLNSFVFTGNRVKNIKCYQGKIIFIKIKKENNINLTAPFFNIIRGIQSKDYGSSVVNFDTAYIKEDIEFFKKQEKTGAISLLEKIVNLKQLNQNRFYFCISFYDQWKRILLAPSINNLNSSIVSRDFPLTSNFNESIIHINFSYYGGQMCANKFIIPYGYQNMMGKKYNIKLQAVQFSGLFPDLEMSQESQRFIFFEIDNCKEGESFDGEVCQPCPINTYLSKNISGPLSLCQVCGENMNINCYGANLTSPKGNYWRKNEKSQNILKCPSKNCLGDINFNFNITNYDCFNCFLPNSNDKELIYSYNFYTSSQGVCAKGYRGVLCTECLEGYGSSQFECADCSELSVYFQHFLLMFFKIFMFYYSNKRALKNKMSSYEEISNREFHNKVLSSYLLKVLFFYFNYLSILTYLPLETNQIFESFLSIFSNVSPTEEFKYFSIDCLLKRINISIASSYLILLLNLLFFSISFVLLILSCARSEKIPMSIRTLGKYIKKNFEAFFLIFFMDNIILFLGPFFKILICLNIDDENSPDLRIMSNPILKCWDNLHSRLVYFLSIPILTIFGVIIPVYISIRIISARIGKTLKNRDFLKTFGYFVYPYREKVNYFESFEIVNKIGLVVVKEIFILKITEGEQSLMVMILIIYIEFFLLLNVILRPYDKEKYSVLQKIKNQSFLVSISNCFIALIWHLSIDNWDSVGPFLIFYLLLTNLIFITTWMMSYFKLLRDKKILIFGRNFNPFTLKISIRDTKKDGSTHKENGIRENTEGLFTEADDNEKIIEKLRKEVIDLKNFNKLLVEQIVRIQARNSFESHEEPESPINNINPSGPIFGEYQREETLAVFETIEQKKIPLEKSKKEKSSSFIKMIEKKIEGNHIYDTLVKYKFQVIGETTPLENLRITITELQKGKNVISGFFIKEFILLFISMDFPYRNFF